jgi:hypothetical protein
MHDVFDKIKSIFDGYREVGADIDSLSYSLIAFGKFDEPSAGILNVV